MSATRRATAKGRKKASGPSYQLHPDPDRYKEIQQALAERGYFKGEANGTWGPDSVDALKRFQADQKITDDGKVGALSLKALGLGPKHEVSATAGSGAALTPTTPATSAPAGGIPPAEPPAGSATGSTPGSDTPGGAPPHSQ